MRCLCVLWLWALVSCQGDRRLPPSPERGCVLGESISARLLVRSLGAGTEHFVLLRGDAGWPDAEVVKIEVRSGEARLGGERVRAGEVWSPLPGTRLDHVRVQEVAGPVEVGLEGICGRGAEEATAAEVGERLYRFEWMAHRYWLWVAGDGREAAVWPEGSSRAAWASAAPGRGSFAVASLRGVIEEGESAAVLEVRGEVGGWPLWERLPLERLR